MTSWHSSSGAPCSIELGNFDIDIHRFSQYAICSHGNKEKELFLETFPNIVHINVHRCPNCSTLLLTVSRYTMHSFRPIIYLPSIIHHWVVLSHGGLLRSLWPTTSFHLSCSGWGRHNHDLLFRSAVRGEYHRTSAHLAAANMQAVFDNAVQYLVKVFLSTT